MALLVAHCAGVPVVTRPPTRPAVTFPVGARATLGHTLGRERSSQTYVCRAQQGGKKNSFDKNYSDDAYLKIRAEVEAPFRQFRLVIFSFFAVSAGAATLFGVPQIIATVVGAANAKSVEEVGMDAVINVGALLLCGFLAKRELDSRDKSIARIRREETLGQCKVELSTGRVTQLGSLRSFSRCIVFAGTPEHVQRCIDAAEPFKDRLLDAGVTLVPLPIFGEPVDGVPTPPAEDEDKRWRVRAVRTDEWKAWLLDQMATAGKTEKEARERGLFIGLRLDGRVRSSGLGVPPFERFSLELAPLEGENAWGGLLDGFDGRVSMFQ